MEGRVFMEVSKPKSSSGTTKYKSKSAHLTPLSPHASGGRLDREGEGAIEGTVFTMGFNSWKASQ